MRAMAGLTVDKSPFWRGFEKSFDSPFEETAIFFFGAMLRFFGSASIGNILVYAERSRLLSAHDQRHADDSHFHERPVAPPAFADQTYGLAGHHALHQSDHFALLAVRRDQAIEFLPGDLGERIAEKRSNARLHVCTCRSKSSATIASGLFSVSALEIRSVLRKFLLCRAARADVLRDDQYGVLTGKGNPSAGDLDVEHFAVLPAMPPHDPDQSEWFRACESN